MLAFGTLVYLDVEKTGSTYILAFMRRFMASSEAESLRHRPVELRDPKKIYVISCRDPLQQYRSLYAYGCQGEGKMLRYMTRIGMKHLYNRAGEGFVPWLKFLLSPEATQQYAMKGNSHPLLQLVGLQTLRFLRLALPDYLTLLANVQTRDDVKAVYEEHALADVLLRQESLNGDLAAMVSGPYGYLFKDVADVPRYLEEEKFYNTSSDLGIDLKSLRRRLLNILEEREWFFLDVLGYQPYQLRRS